MIAVGEEDDFLHAADGCRVAAQTSCVTEAETVFLSGQRTQGQRQRLRVYHAADGFIQKHMARERRARSRCRCNSGRGTCSSVAQRGRSHIAVPSPSAPPPRSTIGGARRQATTAHRSRADCGCRHNDMLSRARRRRGALETGCIRAKEKRGRRPAGSRRWAAFQAAT